MPNLTDPKAVRCIAFDAAGTLIEPFPGIAEAYERFGRRHGSRLTTEEIEAGFRQSFRKHFRPAGPNMPTDEAADKRRWRQTVNEVLHDVESADRCFEELYEHFATSTAWRVFDDVAATISALADRGFRIVIASNFDGRLHQVCERIPCLAGYPRMISTEIGFNKPAARFFEHIVSSTDLMPQQVLMVGDDQTNDVDGAVAAGLQAIWLNRDASNDVPTDSIGSLLDLVEILPAIE